MLQPVAVEQKQLADYAPIVGEHVVEELRQLAQPLQGAKVLHVNATAFGGGVVEILQTLVPLMRDLGLDAHWQVIEGEDEFFNVTKAIHNGLQGMELDWNEQMFSIWERYNKLNAEKFEGDYDYVVIHDPQPAGLYRYVNPQKGHWMWRCHIDTSTPNPAYWDFLAPYVGAYPRAIFTMARYAGPGLKPESVCTIPPSIDPLAEKNVALDREEARSIVAGDGFDPKRPLLVQISRFDPWKDPLGVIDAYRIVKQRVPGVQLALVGSMASDDPEGWEFYDRTVRHAGEDYDVRVLHNFHGVNNREVNAFQTAADVVIQKSTREGFGLVVTEAMWKGKPVVAGNVGGIPMQIVDGQSGYLVEDVAECAKRIIALLQQPDSLNQMGQAARERVRQRFLSTRHLADYLKLFNRLRSP